MMAVDPYFDNVVLLLNMDEPDGSTVFVDRSHSNHAITAFGDTHISSSIPGFGSSAKLDGNGDYIYVPNSSDFYLDADFTIELSIFLPAAHSDYARILGYTPDSVTHATDESFVFEITSTNHLSFYIFGSQTAGLQDPQSFPISQSVDISASRIGNEYKMFVNGNLVDSYIGVNSVNNPIGAKLRIGRWNGSSTRYVNGYIKKLRITKSVGRYSNNYIPQAGAFPTFGPAIVVLSEPAPLPTGTPATIPGPVINPCHTYDAALTHNGYSDHGATCLPDPLDDVYLNSPEALLNGTPVMLPDIVLNPVDFYDGDFTHDGSHDHDQSRPSSYIPPDTPGVLYDPPEPVYAVANRAELHLLPPNATPQEKALSLAVARAGAIPAAVRPLWNADTCPRHLLTWLAWGLSVDVWSDEWSESRKREVIRSSLDVHRHKGTPGAIRNALVAMGYNSATVEDSGGDLDPFHFKVSLGVTTQVSDNDLAVVDTRINQFKNARSQLQNIRLFSLFHNGFAIRDGQFNYSGDVNG